MTNCVPTIARLSIVLASAGFLSSSGASAAATRKPRGSPAVASTKSSDAAIYALVELTQPATAARYATQLGVTSSAARATTAAVNHLATVQFEQASFARTLATARLPGMTEVYRLQRVFNGILYRTPSRHLAALKALPGVKAVHIITPKVADNSHAVPFVNVPSLWINLGLPVHGEGIRVGVIDTGIDYTHANFGGPGTIAAFQSNDPNVVETGTFPTAKVVGGWDFAGPIYDASSTEQRKFTPMPDPDPIDESGHGSHVAGTIAGFGVNPDGSTYAGNYDQSFVPSTFRIGPGAAPNALLYALKVFGDVAGSTNLDALALEWAVDPNGDGNFADHLDVVNLSLGGSYGTSDVSESAIFTNAVKAGVVVVCAAGNAADIYFITGAPATTPEVISVAASSIGDYSAIQVNPPAALAGLKQDAGSSPLIPATNPLTGDLVASVPIDGCAPFTNAAAVAGKIAFVERGACTFLVKLQNAQAAGAVGAIVWNQPPNADNLVTMLLDNTVTIISRLIGNTDGTAITSALAAGSVNLTIDDSLSLTKPAELDQVASFTSR